VKSIGSCRRRRSGIKIGVISRKRMRSLEYKIDDLLKAGDQNKTKPKRSKVHLSWINCNNLAAYAYVKTICNLDYMPEDIPRSKLCQQFREFITM
jgi:hypothetical protein